MMELTKQKLTLIIAAVITIFAVGLYLFLYSPLLESLKEAYLEVRYLEGAVLLARDRVALTEAKNFKNTLINEKEVPLLIEELTKAGKSGSIDFISVSPRQIEKSKDGSFRILPIELEIESSYKDLGSFLSLYGNEQSEYLVKLKNFEIMPHKESPEKLKTKLTLDVYLKAENEE